MQERFSGGFLKKRPDIFHLLEDEAMIIKESGGEIPEVVYYNALYYLMEDPTGPRLNLEDKDLKPLKEAVRERYKLIILRDLEPDNRDKPIYRGLRRAIINWGRLKAWVKKSNLSLVDLKLEIARHLASFLDQICKESSDKIDKRALNCKGEDLLNFIKELGLPLEERWLFLIKKIT